MTTSALASLAVLKVNWDTLGKDYLENFVPIIVESIRLSADDVISLPVLKSILKTEFGHDLPLNPLRQILRRAAKQGYVRIESGVYYRNLEKCNSQNFRDTQRKVETIYSEIISALQNFAKSQHGLDWKTEFADSALYDFLRDNTLSLLFSLNEEDLGRKNGVPKYAYIVAGFLAAARAANNFKLLEDFEVLLKGNLLLNAMYLPDTGKLGQRFQKTRVYIDTSVLVYACGYAGTDRAEPALELLSLLKEYNADIYCLRGTVDEIHGILDACSSRLLKGNLREAYGPSMEYFIESGKTASDVELMRARLPIKLRSLGVEIDEKPPYDPNYQIDEAGLEQALNSAIRYSSQKALLHDVDCISAVARLRRGRESSSPETCGALFVTSNTKLARATRQFFQADAAPGTVALCLTDYALGNLLWLKNPTKAPTLPIKRLLADVYAAIQPSEQLWKKYLVEISKLETSGVVNVDEYYLLRHTLAAKTALMDLTQGNVDVFSEGTAKEILVIAKENVRADLKEAVAIEKEQTRMAQLRAETLVESDARQRNTVRERANRLAKLARYGITFFVVLTLFIGLVYSFPFELKRPTSTWAPYLLPAIFFIVLLSTFANLYWGTTVKSLLDRIEGWLSSLLKHQLHKLVGLDESAPEK